MIISEVRTGSSENTMKLYTFDAQVGYATHRPTGLLGEVCDYLDLLFLSSPNFSISFPAPP